MSNITLTRGNLALAVPAPSPRPRLTVIEGGKGSTAAAPAAAAPQRAAAPAAGPRPTSHLRIAGALALTAALVAVVVTFAVVRGAARANAIEAIVFEEVAVAPGDSLWSLAEAHPAEGLTTDDLVLLIQERNGLERAGLIPGQVVSVPAR
ncbi:MAG: LysM peptidoglycan-binding domain-containing protein [Coriobacteriaceae bacterium]|nr:LysM peptidoglycan-binding domain-containing protein [Coriobacteriaceae bacterium]